MGKVKVWIDVHIALLLETRPDIPPLRRESGELDCRLSINGRTRGMPDLDTSIITIQTTAKIGMVSLPIIHPSCTIL